MRHVGRLLLAVTILLVAINLRPAMAALGPLLDLIEQSTGLNSAGAGLLTTLPVFLMGVCALLGRHLRRALGELNGVTLGVVLIALACASRAFWGTAAGMLIGATVVGVGVALVQALLPGVIKSRFALATGRMMGLYTTGIMGGAAIAAASAPWLNAAIGWQYTLAFWVMPAVLAWWLWAATTRGDETSGSAQVRVAPMAFWRYPRAWTLLLFFGVGTGAYTLILAWLPPFYVELGQSRHVAGNLLAGLTLTEVVSGLVVSAVVGRFHDRRPLVLAALMSTLAGLALMHTAPLQMALPAMLCLGAGVGALFPLSLILAMDHIEDPESSGDLAAFVQGGGYMMASLMPFFAGWIRGAFASLSFAWGGMFIAIACISLLALRFSPASYRHAFRH